MIITYLCAYLYLLSGLAGTASSGARSIQELYNEFLWGAVPLLLIILGLLVYIIIRYRGKKGEVAPSRTHSNVALETFLVLFFTAVVVFYFIRSVQVMVEMHKPTDNRKPDIVVVGHQWWWEVRYPGTGVVTANEFHMPTNTRLLISFRSADVVHDFWVPALGRKMDMFHNHSNYIWMDIDKPGVYEGACSEFCGAEHAWMRIHVIAQSPDDFKKWLNANAKPADAPQNELAEKGKDLFMNSTCVNCHSIRGTKAKGDIGPDLTHIGSRHTLLTGMLVNNVENMNKWLTNPQNVKPGAHMPNFRMSVTQVQELTAYLEGLK